MCNAGAGVHLSVSSLVGEFRVVSGVLGDIALAEHEASVHLNSRAEESCGKFTLRNECNPLETAWNSFIRGQLEVILTLGMKNSFDQLGDAGSV